MANWIPVEGAGQAILADMSRDAEDLNRLRGFGLVGLDNAGIEYAWESFEDALSAIKPGENVGSVISGLDPNLKTNIADGVLAANLVDRRGGLERGGRANSTHLEGPLHNHIARIEILGAGVTSHLFWQGGYAEARRPREIEKGSIISGRLLGLRTKPVEGGLARLARRPRSFIENDVSGLVDPQTGEPRVELTILRRRSS